jgi:hypothetical protein
MLGRDDDEHFVPRHHHAVQVRLLDRTFDEAELRLATHDRHRDLLGIAGAEPELDAAMLPVERDQVPRQPVAGNRLAGLDDQRAALAAAEFHQQELRRRRLGQNGARRAEENLAGLGERDAAADAVKEFRTVTRFQRRNCSAHGRLAEVKCLRRAGHVLAFRDRDENTQLI